MRALFCCDPLEPRRPDEAFRAEVEAAKSLGFSIDLIDHEALVRDRPGVLRAATLETETCVVYRGWMMSPAAYARLFEELRATKRVLINTPDQYEHCHYLPRTLELLGQRTPRTVWFDGAPALDDVMAKLSVFGDQPLVLKDFVKSQKHAWREACFIPNASDRPAVERVMRRFVELQGEHLEGGLVFRAFIELERVGTHPRSGMPLSREVRQFFLDGQPLLTLKYWDEAAYELEFTLPSWALELAKRINSRFFTMDFARTASGEWMIVEVGDGQVSGLPTEREAHALMTGLRDAH